MTGPTAQPVAVPADLLAGVREALDEVLADRLAGARGEDHRMLWRLLAETVRGGKMIRPLLLTTVATYGAVTADAVLRRRASAAGAAFELLHAGLIVHDDIMDRDVLRRGRPTVPAALEAGARHRGAPDPHHLATSAAIIVGDLALTGAYRLLVDGGPRSGELIDIMDRAVRDAAEGQFLDIAGVNAAEPTEAEVLEVARLKTAVYSFEAPVAAGSVLADLDAATCAELIRGARDLGTAFQVVDDVIGTFGDPSVTGKSDSSDLSSRTWTVLTVHAAAVAVPGWVEVWEALGAGPGPGQAAVLEDRARDLLRESGSLVHAQQLSARLHTSARAHFTAPGVPALLAERLLALTDQLEARRR